MTNNPNITTHEENQNEFGDVRVTRALKDLKTTAMLSADAKARIRMRLETLVQTSAPRKIASPFMFSFFSLPYMPLVALALILVVGAGTASAAQNALPGDVLYPLKVNVNERVATAVAQTPEAKATLDISHAEERLREVELLAARGDVSENTINNAKNNVEEHIKNAQSVARTLLAKGDRSGAESLDSRISSTLLSHVDILNAQAEGKASTDLSNLTSLSDSIEPLAALDTEDAVTSTAGVESEPTLLISHIEGKLSEFSDLEKGSNLSTTTDLALINEAASIRADLETLTSTHEASLSEYEPLLRRAYRLLALLVSAERIHNSTGKDVLIDFDSEATTSVPTAPEASVLPKAAATLSVPAEETPLQKRMMLRERKLQFRVSERNDE